MRNSSPIETALLNAIAELAPTLGLNVHVLYGWRSFAEPPVETADDYSHSSDTSPAQADLLVWPQAMIDGYKADFLIGLSREIPRPNRDSVKLQTLLAVECDGHEWHERTQQQAAYDRARDRALLFGGIVTIRFTGSEIHRDANQCAREAVRAIQTLQHQTVLAVREHVVDAAHEILDRAFAEVREERERKKDGGD